MKFCGIPLPSESAKVEPVTLNSPGYGSSQFGSIWTNADYARLGQWNVFRKDRTLKRYLNLSTLTNPVRVVCKNPLTEKK